MLSSLGYVTNGVTTARSKKMDGRKLLIGLWKLAPQVRFEPTRLRASRSGVVSPKLAVSLGERAKADNPPVNRRVETPLCSDQTLSLLMAH
jgi:hypothetical protein